MLTPPGASFGRWRGAATFCVLVAFLNVVPASAQGFGPKLLDRPAQRQPRRDVDRVFTADVNLVLVPVTVTDLMGRTVQGLQQGNFKIFEDKAPQQIVSFSSQDAPCSIGLLFDKSSSMGDKISKSRLATRAFFETANPEDEVFLITFANRPELRVDFTSEFASIQNSLLLVEAKGTTALIDAIYLGLERSRFAQNPRKALLVVSDGGDNNSRHLSRELKRMALEADVQVHAIGIHDNPHSVEEGRGTDLLQDLSQATGGQHFIIRNISDLREAAAKIGVVLHNQYVLGYYPPVSAPVGTWRRIQVQLSVPKGLSSLLRVYARSGYYTPE